MSDQSGSSHFKLRVLFVAALEDYKQQTGMELPKHPLADRLEDCNTVDRVTAIFREQAQDFKDFRDKDKVLKPLKKVLTILHILPSSADFAQDVGLHLPPVKAIQTGLGILLSAVKGVIDDYSALADLLESIGHFLNRLGIYTEIPPTEAMNEMIVKILVELLSTLALTTKETKQGKLKKLVRKLVGEKKMEAMVQRLDRLTQDEARQTVAQILKVVHGLVQNMKVVMNDGEVSVDYLKKTLEIMHRVASDLNKAKRESLQKDIFGWLSPPDPWKNHRAACKSRHRGTAEWFIQGNTFIEWKLSEVPGSLLWVHGKPGAGKTVFCSTIIEDIHAMQKAGLASLAFFYCDFRENRKKELRGLLSSFLVQLYHQSDSYFDILLNFYSAHGKGSRPPSDDALAGCLKDLLNLPGLAPVYLIVDALDECPIPSVVRSPRAEILSFVDELVTTEILNLRVCVTGRPELDIKGVLDPLIFRSVSLHDESGQNRDVEDYIKWVINTRPKKGRWKKEHRKLAIDVLVEKSNGMFRWADCQVDHICDCIPARIRHALNELPETLDETYERALRGINRENWEFAHRMFQFVSVATRPLYLEELADLLAFDFEAGSIPKFYEDWRLEDPVDAVLSTCPTLFSIVNDGASHIIHFSHFSVKEFLTSTRLAEATDIISRSFHVSMALAHTLASQACLGILLHLDKDVTSDSLEDFPLAEYAAEHWVDHARFEGVSRNVENGMKLLFDPRKLHLAICVWIYDPAVPTWKRMTRNETPLPLPQTSLHYAAFWGLHSVVEFLIIEHSQDVCSRDSTDNATPLHLASRNGHVRAARRLIRRGADVTARNNDGWAPLHLASQRGQIDVVPMLIGPGADVTAQSNNGETPLHLASEMGQVDVACMLIERGADVSAQDNYGWTPLHAALGGRHQGVALSLLKRGADIGCLDSQSRAPLHIACREWTDVVSVLIHRGADLNAEDDNRETPLHVSSQWGRGDIIQLLLDHGAEADHLDSGGWTPLHVASYEGHDKIVNLLFNHGADANRPDNSGWTPLLLASWEGHEHIVRLLLDHGVNTNHPDNCGWTPLHAASQEGHNHIVELLLDHSVDLNHANSDGSTSLHVALQRNHHYIVQLLLDYGADPNYPNSDGSTSLHLASQRGHDNTVWLLLHRGAVANRLNGDGWASLHLASQRGHKDVVGLLLKHGADSNHAHSNGLTPLHLASQEGHDHVVRLLLDRGADPNSLNSDGWTPLHLASQRSHGHIVRLLLKRGADADHPNSDSLTPMGFASREGGVEQKPPKAFAMATRKRLRM